MKKMKYAAVQLNVKTILGLFAFLVIAIACALPLFTVNASNPATGTLTPTTSGQVTWVGTGVGGTTNGESSCVEGTNCDTYTLTISGNQSDWTGKFAHVEIDWTLPATDYDLYIHKDNLSGAIVASSANGTTTSEAVDLDPATIGTGVYVVHVLYFTSVGAADQYHGAASVKTATSIAPATPASGPAPRFQIFTPPQSVLNNAAKGTDAGEPSIGVNWKTGKIFFQSDLTTFRVSFDDSCPTSPVATWEDKSATTSVDSLDPIMFTDHGYNNQTPDTGRTIVSQLSGTTSLSSYTDNDGDTWIPDTGGGLDSGVDHQTVGGGGPFHSPIPAGLNPLYPHATYYCSQDIGAASCALSVDGGQTYASAVPIYTLADCGGLHGHVKVGPDGAAYVPNKGCGTGQAVVVSEDNGVTWSVRKVPNSTTASSDPSVAVGRGDQTKGVGRLYFGFANGDSKAVVAVSDDNGKSWKNFADVGASFNINNVAFPAMIAGDDDRAAFTFLGSATPGAGQDRAFPGFWHLYIATTYDGGLTWSTVDATPNDAVQRNGIWLGGGSPPHRNLLDFIGADMDKTGHVVVGYADGCTGAACVQAPDTATGNSYTSLASIARQTGGKGLFASADTNTNLTVPGAPSLTVGRDGTVAHITLSESDNGGSAITGYKIMRGTASGAETLLTTIPGSQVSYNDTTADANTVYYYSVVAVNAQGESCGSNEVVSKPTGSSCTDMKVVSDPTADQKSAPLNGDLDIQSVSMAEPYFADNSSKLVFKMKISDPAVQSNRQWRILWNYPVKAADIADTLFTGTYYVGMNTDASGVRSFEYGTVTTVEAVPANTSTPNMIGVADSNSSFDAATGIITIVLDPVKVGSPKAGDVIGKLAGRTFAGNGNTTVLSTSAIDATSITGTIDPYTAGTYMLVGNLPCNTATAPTYEGDVQSRPSGDGFIDSDDIQQIRRFAVGLDLPYQSNEFQRADVSPRSGFGDGFVDSDDVQQARRYSVGLDSKQPSSGPTTSGSSGNAAALFEDWKQTTKSKSTRSRTDSANTTAQSITNNTATESITQSTESTAQRNSPEAGRAVRIVNQSTSPGQTITVPINVDTTGDETGYTFSIAFDQTKLSATAVTIGSLGGNVTSNINNTTGTIGFSITSFSGTNGVISAATDQSLVTITFTVAGNASQGMTNITFTDNPARRKVSGIDPNTALPQPTFTDGTVSISGPTAATVTVGGRVKTPAGRGISGVRVSLTDSNGQIRTAITTSFGYYQFENVQTGETYILSAKAKHFTFNQPTQLLNATDDTNNIDFIAYSQR